MYAYKAVHCNYVHCSRQKKRYLKKKLSEIKPYFLALRVLWKKILEIKSLWNQSPTILKLYFLGIYFWFNYNFTQKRPRKKSYYSRKCMGTKDVFNRAKKRQFISKTPQDIYNMRMVRKKSFL